MSQDFNPFQSPQPGGYPPVGAFAPVKATIDTPPSDRSTIGYAEGLRFQFAHPQWMMTLLFGTICQFIPVVGPLVFLGYQFETLIDLTTSRGAQFRPFDWNRFVPYLKRGLWPFLAAMVMALVAVPLLYFLLIVIVIGAAGLASLGGEDLGPVIGFVGMVVGLVLFMVATVGLQVLLQPLLLRAALTQNFAEGFQLSFATDFIRRVRKELVYCLLFQMAVGFVAILLGMLACFFGIYPAMIVMLLMQAHLQFQLYELYRARGGETIPITSAD